eukprot:TRINITY_DN1020_c0_g1_i1.p1 TRINITY_DN1020_c0_g1~~TRINITY_DN1020_c0_g1_i1.p1  ORF type:complete len:634 (-),score=175.80 TRINITY_DN1020_c0_g1_i1:79-1980(-)
MKKGVLGLIFCLFFSFNLVYSVVNISTCQDLDSIEDNSIEVYTIVNNIDCSKLAGYTAANNFGGLINGNNRYITNLNVTGTNVGLFASTSPNCTIKDVFITNSVFNGVTAGVFAGLIQGSFVNCTSIGNTITGSSGVGGFGGKATSGRLEVSQCSSNLNTITTNQTGSFSIGGFIGYSKADSSQFHHFIGSTSDENSITIISIGNTSDQYVYGGFAGHMVFAQVESCTSTNNIITGTKDNYSGVGGFAGLFEGNLTNSLSTLNAIITNDSSTVGGFIGTFTCGIYTCTIKNCVSTSNQVSGGSISGGFVGQVFQPGIIVDSTSSFNLVEGKYSNSALNLVRGGFVGFQYTGFISNSTSTFNQVNSQGTKWSSAYTGGFAGFSTSTIFWSSSINNTVFAEVGDVGGFAGSSIGEIADSMVYNTDGLNDIFVQTSNGNAGGLVGSSSKLTIFNCMVVLSGIRTLSPNKFSGGIIGNRSTSLVSILDSYFVGRTFVGSGTSKRGGIIIGGGSLNLDHSYPVKGNFWDSSYMSAKPYIDDSAEGISPSKFTSGVRFSGWEYPPWCFIEKHYPFLAFGGACQNPINVPNAPNSPYPSNGTRDALISVFVILLVIGGVFAGILIYRKYKSRNRFEYSSL